MARTLTPEVSGEYFSSAQTGPMAELDQYEFVHPKLGGKGFPGKLFLQEALGLTSMEVSLNKLPAGAALPFYHRHREHEELYLFVSGRGQFQVDGTIIDVAEGTVIRVSPEGARTWRSHATEDLYYIVVQATANALTASGIDDGQAIDAPVTWPE